jgi:chromosome segregation ATPase
MALLKTKTTDAFVVPSLSAASPEHKALVEKQTELQGRYSELHSERAKLRREIEAEEAAGKQRLAPEVARLLGDPADSVTALSNRHREVAVEMGHIEVAQETLRRRLSEARNGASKAVCDVVRGEYQRRLGAVCEAAKALEAAREQHDALLDDIEREDVNLAYLRAVRPFFLGDRHDGKVSYFLREVKEAGHNA